MKRLFWIFPLIAVLLAGGACGKDPIPPVVEDVVEEEEEDPTIVLDRATPLSLSAAQVAYVREANLFSGRMLLQMEQNLNTDSWFCSPMSVSFALTMLLNGTRGEAAGELSSALGYGADFDPVPVNDYCRQYIQRAPSWDPAVTLSFANALFANRSYPVKDTYKAALRQNFFAMVSNRDFSKEKETVDYINGWSNDKTQGMIPKLLDSVSPDDQLYLINVVYFKGGWKEPFEEFGTKKTEFTRTNGKMKYVQMMHHQFSTRFAETPMGIGTELEYGDSCAFAMQFFLPQRDKVRQAAEYIAVNGWSALFAGATQEVVDVKIPRFEVQSTFDLKRTILPAMGIKKVFDAPDFSLISDYAVGVSSVLHKAAVSVHEKGAEAAAATTEMLATDPFPPEMPVIKDFHADHPFFFAIVEKQSGAVLFIGKYGG